MSLKSVNGLRSPDAILDGISAVLLILSLLFPWNIHFGLGIRDTTGWIFVLIFVAALAPIASVITSHTGGDLAGKLAKRRLLLTAPYLAAVLIFIGFTILQSFRLGGTGAPPPGIGPGLLLGLAGAILVCRPSAPRVDDQASFGRRARRIIGAASVLSAVLAVGLNLYWRTRFVLPGITDPESSRQHLVVAVTAVLYAVVCLAPVVFAARWVVSAQRHAQLAATILGGSVLIAVSLVWVLPVGRELDAFHGIAQSTSTAGVGYEGYLAWIAAAAMIGPTIAWRSADGRMAETWAPVVRSCLLVIALWCAGSALLRVADIASAAVLNLPAPAYNSIAIMAFDLATALLAMWTFINGRTTSMPQQVWLILSGALFALTVARVVVGVALVPRVKPLNANDINDVYGNTLSQQITSAFDVGLCCVSASLLCVAFALAGQGRRRVTPTAKQDSPDRDRTPRDAELAALSPRDKAAKVLAESTTRFAAGTTYGDEGSTGRRR